MGIRLAMKYKLTGLKIELCSNDYVWENQFGTIVSCNSDFSSCLIDLEEAHHAEGKIYSHVLAKARSDPADLREIVTKGIKDVGAYWISEDRLVAARNFDASWWRGGAASTVTLMPARDYRA